ncbi:MAG: hypothetical protein WC839_03710 [Candidatus Paceibacterota bacterium]
MNKNKGFSSIAILVLVVAVLAIGGGAYYVGKNSDTPIPIPTPTPNPIPDQNEKINPTPVPKPNSQAQKSFLYNKLTDVIPERFYTNFSSFLTNDYYGKSLCVSTGELAEIVLLDQQISNCPANSPPGGCSGNTTMSAVICGNQYVIEKFNLSGGQFYGPFNLKQ